MQALSSTHAVLLQLISKALFGAPVSLPDEIDWNAVYREAAAQAVSPLAFSVAEPYLPEPVRKCWEEHALQAAAQNVRVRYEHSRLHEMLSSAGIPYAILKGTVSASYYPVPALRMLGDVDFLVRKSDMEQASGLLEAAGFQPVENNVHEAHIAFSNNSSTWEMHWSLCGIPSGAVGSRVQALLDAAIDTSAVICDGEDSYCAPDAFHHGLVLLIHTAEHLPTSGIGLRHLCDWAAFVHSLSGDAFCELFAQPLRSVGLYRFAQILTLLCSDYLALPVQPWSLCDCTAEQRRQLISDILDGGNFGHKRADYLEQSRLLHMRAANDSTKSVLRGTVKILNERTCKSMPVLRQHPALLPIGWALTLAKRMLRGISGKQIPVRPLTLLQRTSKRKALYRTLQLYSAELTSGSGNDGL